MRRKSLTLRWLIASIVFLALCASGAAAPAAETPASPRERPTREIYVPFADLHVLLEQQSKRVLLSREQFDDLVKKAKKAPETHAPRPAVIVAADYNITAGPQRAEIQGTLTVDVLEDGLHGVPLELAGVGLLDAKLDNRNAAIGRGDAGPLLLFVEGLGRHELTLSMVAPLETTAARQVLNLRLPHPASARLRLSVPGDVEIKTGADVVSRTVDSATKLTRFELLPREGDMTLVMTLNSHLQRQQRAVAARSVLVDEVTQAYEKLHATVSLAILYRAVDQFQFTVPDGFEIIEVNSPLLARWDVQAESGRKLLNVRLREQTTETVVLRIAAIRTPSRLENWHAPRLDPLDVVSNVAVLGLVVEDRLKAESLAAGGLIPIDTSVLAQALPATLLEAAPGAPAVRMAAAWYAPQSEFSLKAEYKKPPAEMAVTTGLLLVVADKGQEVVGGLSLLPRVEKRFSFDVSVPAGWQVASVTAADGKPLMFERYPVTEGAADDAAARIRITVPAGMPVGQEFKANFRALRTPPGWLEDWASLSVKFPAFAVLDATRDDGAIAVDARDDITVRPDKLRQLTPLDAAEKPKYGLEGVATTLAYRYENAKYAASLAVERTRPRLTARTFSFLRIDPDSLNCHYELVYTVEEARTQRLALLLPKSTPASLSITGLDGVNLKEFGSEMAGENRRWNVLLAEPRRDRVRLAVDFRQPLPSQEPKGLALPIVAADGVAYQSGLVAVEGCAELEVQVDASARRVDVGELSEADYQPGRRLLGALGFVGNPSPVKIDVVRHPGYRIYPTIVEECLLDTNLAAEGQSQTQARFKLRTKAVYLQVKLPARAELWSAVLDGVPLKPQREDSCVLIDVPAGTANAAQTLEIVYAAPVSAVALRGTVDVPAPKLLLRNERGQEAMEVPLADLQWRLHLPSGYEAVAAGGTLSTDDIEHPRPAAVEVAGILYRLTGGLSGPPLLMPTVYSARESARKASPYYIQDYVQERGDEKSAAAREDPFADSEGEKEQFKKGPTEWRKLDEVQSRDGKPEPYFLREGDFAAAPQKPADSLSGTRSLKIDVVQTPAQAENVLTFRSLGVEPLLVVTLANRARLSALGWGLALAVGLAGVAMTRRPARKKTAFILTIAIAATLLPLLVDSIEVAELCNMLFYAACLLVPYYLLAGAVRWLCGPCCRACTWCAGKLAGTRAAPTTAVAILLAACWAADASAAPPVVKSPSDGPYVIQVVEPPKPVNVPADAIVVPYDPDWKNVLKDADKLLVPYDKYVELWNRAYPDKKIETKAAPAPYALAGATYKTVLEGDEYLLLAGQMEVDVFADGFVQIPLGLSGGVLAQAELDGKPARLSIATVDTKPLAASQPTAPSLLVLHVSGKGRHKLELSVRLKLSRQGGWRVAEGTLPSAPAAALQITVPKPQTELRLGQVSDRRSYETQQADEIIHTVLGDRGAVSLHWRPKLSEGQVDRSLTAASSAVFDVQEDGLRLAWQLGLEFRRSQRERFEVALPAGFLLEKVEGNNVRGWEIHKADKGQTVEITLLQAAKDHEQFTLRLWRAAAVGRELTEFDVPLVSVGDAAFHNGQLTIRRSPLLELRTLDRSGATRTDLPGDSTGAAGGPDSPLGIRPFEAYNFAAVPFSIRLAAAPVTARTSATVQTVLRIAAYQRSLESRITVAVQGRPVYQLQMLLPDDLSVDHVSAPGAFQYAVTSQGKRPLLTIYLAAGQQGAVPVLVRGRLGREGELKELPLPRLEVLGVDRQQGEVAVQVDPAFDVDATNLSKCEPMLLSRLHAWLNPQQQQVTRLGLHYAQGDYAGTLRLTPRKADVVCDTITNVRVTDRAIEETILLDFTIQRAGVRELSFLLPATMAGSRISAPMLRQKTIEPVGKEPGAPLRVRIELQDEVMDQLRILVENDRLLTPGSHAVPIPTVELGRTNRRYVAVESAGRDLVTIEDDKLRDMETLGRQQREWETLKGILGREMTLAYLVAADARQPRLSFHTEAHAAVETVGARIGLAETTLVLDANGAYRAQEVLRMDNSTEQYLEIRLPEGAELWTARVAGEPVKPTRLPGAADPRRVRIPIIKTASGELSYDVVLKYGGKMPAIGAVDRVAFPLIHCENIRPELSQARLYVPEQYRWFDFGGTMRPVAEEADLQAGFIKFQTRQTQQIMATLRQGDKWAKVRAAANLKTQQALVSDYRAGINANGDGSNSNLQAELIRNGEIIQQASQEVRQLEEAPQQATEQSNRLVLNERFAGQKFNRARNVVNELGANFYETPEPKPAGTSASSPAISLFNGQWLSKNGLTSPNRFSYAGSSTTTVDTSREGLYSADLDVPFGSKDGKSLAQQSRPSAARIVIQEEEEEKLASPSSGKRSGGKAGGEERQSREADSLGRYKQRLEEQGAGRRLNESQVLSGGQVHLGGIKLGVGVNSDSGLVGSDARERRLKASQLFSDSAPTAMKNIDRASIAPNAAGQRLAIGRIYNRMAGPAGAPEAPAATTAPGEGGDRKSLGQGVPGDQPIVLHGVSSLGGSTINTTQTLAPRSGMGGGMGGQAAPAAALPPTGLASLDFDLPQRGTLYRFTTPQGEAEITARTCSNDLLRRLGEIAVVAIAALIVCFTASLIRNRGMAWLATTAGSTLLVCLGLLSFFGGILPVVGLIALLSGCGLKLRRRCCRRGEKKPTCGTEKE